MFLLLSWLHHKVIKYKKRLLKEAFKKAKDDGLDTVIYDLIPSDKIKNSTILLHQNYTKNVDITPLLNLIKDNYPSLHSKYQKTLDKYQTELENLKKQLDSFS